MVRARKLYKEPQSCNLFSDSVSVPVLDVCCLFVSKLPIRHSPINAVCFCCCFCFWFWFSDLFLFLILFPFGCIQQLTHFCLCFCFCFCLCFCFCFSDLFLFLIMFTFGCFFIICLMLNLCVFLFTNSRDLILVPTSAFSYLCLYLRLNRSKLKVATYVLETRILFTFLFGCFLFLFGCVFFTSSVN
jgi:hypothetical protein